MRYLKKYENEVKTIATEYLKSKESSFEKLIGYKRYVIIPLSENSHFRNEFTHVLNKCLMDIYGQTKFKHIKVEYGWVLVATLINNMNWYCYQKKLYDKQIEISNVNKLFNYMWGFRHALFAPNPNAHEDVQYLQYHIYKPLISEGIIKFNKK